MAFDQEKFDILKQYHDGTSFCTYREPLTALATIVASGYFDTQENVLATGSIIIVTGSDATSMYKAVNTSGVITLVHMISATNATTSSAAELNILDGALLDVNELNILNGALLDVNELNILNGVTATTAEINNAVDVSTFSQTLTASDAITAGKSEILLDHTSVAIAATIADTANHRGGLLIKAITEPGGGADHTVTITTGTFNGTNKVATFADINDAIFVIFDSAGNGSVIGNVGSVAFSG
jgi:hypothetical protein